MASIHNCISNQGKPRLEVADIFRRHRSLLGYVSHIQSRVIQDIMDCRTEKKGGHLRQCTDCDYQDQSYNSCRNRHCPKCQFLRNQQWVENRKKELLPVEYFHVVFTVPHVLNPVTLQNKRVLYDVLFKAASETIKEVAERKLGAQIGFVAVLHTWGQNLMDHPHLHMIVPGGGLKRDGKSWIPCKKGYLFPIKILSQVFRGKFLSTLEKVHPDLAFHGQISHLATNTAFKKLLIQASGNRWVVYTKKPFAGPEQVVNYLGQYTHRIAISNYRLLKLENECVHFQYRDYTDNNKNKVMTLHVKEFMRRFLLHVLPKKFVRIRHYGFLGNRFRKEKINACKMILGASVHPVEKLNGKKDWKQQLKELTGLDLSICPRCKGEMRDFKTILPISNRANVHLYLDSS